jgi:hypothetical protein
VTVDPYRCMGDRERVGDRGQRFEVRYLDGDELEHVIGWTTDPAGGGLVEVINKHPVWHAPRVIDRLGSHGSRGEAANRHICDCGQIYSSPAGVRERQAGNHSSIAGCELPDAERFMRGGELDQNALTSRRWCRQS